MSQSVVVQQPNGDLNIGVQSSIGQDPQQSQQQHHQPSNESNNVLHEHRIHVISVVTPRSISFHGKLLGVFITMECVYTIILTTMYSYYFFLCVFAFIGLKGIRNNSPKYLKIYACTKILSSILFATLAVYYQNYYALTPAMFDYIIAMMSIRYANEISAQIN